MYNERIIGGASFSPNLNSLDLFAIVPMINSGNISQALIKIAKVNKNLSVYSPFLPKENKLSSPYATDQFVCFPLPLTPLKGFSSNSATISYSSAVFFIISTRIWFWSITNGDRS